jgi:hypothetical protein
MKFLLMTRPYCADSPLDLFVTSLKFGANCRLRNSSLHFGQTLLGTGKTSNKYYADPVCGNPRQYNITLNRAVNSFGPLLVNSAGPTMLEEWR